MKFELEIDNLTPEVLQLLAISSGDDDLTPMQNFTDWLEQTTTKALETAFDEAGVDENIDSTTYAKEIQ